MRRVATLVRIERQLRVVVFNPNGVTGDSPGQRPGFGIKLGSLALKGRNDATQGYVGLNQTAIPCGGLQPQRGDR